MSKKTDLWQEFLDLVQEIADAIELLAPLKAGRPFHHWPLKQIARLGHVSKNLEMTSPPIWVDERMDTLYVYHPSGFLLPFHQREYKWGWKDRLNPRAIPSKYEALQVGADTIHTTVK